MNRFTPVALLLACVMVFAIFGCSGQGNQPAPEQTAEQAPPAAEPPYQDQAAAPVPPPAAPAPSRSANTIPEERQPARPAPAVPSTVTITVPAGTQLTLGFPAEISSETAQPGDAVVATLKESIVIGDRVAFPEGSQVRGTVTDVKPASKGFKDTGGAISMQFKSVVAPNGTKSTIAAGFSKVAEGSAAKKGAIIGGSAVGGALLGKVLDKSTGGGAAVGAAIGTAVAGTTKGREAKIKTDDMIAVPLEQSAKVVLPR
ncbi:MAG TPA: hypothetical protein VFD06_14540 [Candidatus Polarisedimenticolia bacterium]|nr:hypothetical protein [Candidatus Polarisedimenticolia bacterium]